MGGARPPARYARYRDLEFAEHARALPTFPTVGSPPARTPTPGLRKQHYQRKAGPVMTFAAGVDFAFILGTMDWPFYGHYQQRIQAQAIVRLTGTLGMVAPVAVLELQTMDGATAAVMASQQLALPANGSAKFLVQSDLIAGVGARAVLRIVPDINGTSQVAVSGSMAVRLVDPGGAPLLGA